uniref:Uncharacterized protein n=1 Tax=viral metagenome TaxID=1070528 RepID=A0A6C0HA32_9ZZZZ
MSSVLIFSSDIKDATDLPSQLNYDIKDLIQCISDNNKKYLLLSLLKINIKIEIYHEYTSYSKSLRGGMIKDINFLINLLLRSYDDSMNIYPKNLNIIHFIIFNKINIYEVLYLLIKIYYMKSVILIQQDYPSNKIECLEIYKKASYRFSDIPNGDTNELLDNIRKSYDNTNINILFNHNYTDLLFNGLNISNEISILTDKINNLQIQTDNYYKLNEECHFNKQKIINDINHQLNIHYNENNINKNEIMNEISIFTDKINNLQIQTDNYYKLNEECNFNKQKIINDINHQLNIHYNENNINKNEIMNEISILIDKINEKIILIKNEIINDVKQVNIQNNNKLISDITILTTKITQLEIKNNYYYNKINVLENNTYTLNKILSIIIIIYFLIIFIISTFLIFNYNNIIDIIYYYNNHIYIDNNPIVKLQLLN